MRRRSGSGRARSGSTTCSLRERAGRRVVAPGRVLDRDREDDRPRAHARVNGVSGFSTTTSTWRQTKRSESFGSSAPGSRPASQRTWKPLQMPSTGPPSRANSITRLHHRREARDRADAQVVAVGEAAGHDDRVDAAQVAVAVPEQLGVAEAPAGQQRVDLVAGAGEADDAELHAASLDRADRPRSPRSAGSPAAARTSAGTCDGVLDVQLDQPADVHVAPRPRSRAPAAPVRRPAPADRGCPPSAGSARAPSSAERSSQAVNGSPVIALVRLDVALARAARPRRRGAPAPGGVLSQPEPAAQSRTYCLSKLGWPRPGS